MEEIKKGGKMFTKKILKRGIIFAMAIGFLLSLSGYSQEIAQEVTEGKIAEAFQQALNEKISLEKPLEGLTASEIREIILPVAAELIARTIYIVYEKEGIDIGIVEVFAAFPPNVEDILILEKERIEEEVKKLQVE